jgi:hypothetical protein
VQVRELKREESDLLANRRLQAHAPSKKHAVVSLSTNHTYLFLLLFIAYRQFISLPTIQA